MIEDGDGIVDALKSNPVWIHDDLSFERTFEGEGICMVGTVEEEGGHDDVYKNELVAPSTLVWFFSSKQQHSSLAS